MTNETQMKHGAKPVNPIYRWYHQRFKRKQHKDYASGIVDWTTPHTVITPFCKNQANNLSCGGQSASNAIYIDRNRRGIVESELSAKSYYAPAHGDGGGMTVNALITQICAHGGNLESTVPSYDLDGNPLNEQMMEDTSWQTPALIEDALTRAGYTPMNVNIDVDSVAAAIASEGWVIMEITGQNNGTWTSATPLPPSKTNPNELWNHFMVLYDYGMRSDQKIIYAMQSMGKDWGVNGTQYFFDNYFQSGYILDCFTAMHDSLLIPSGDTNNLSPMQLAWRNVCLWFRNLWGLPIQTSPSPS